MELPMMMKPMKMMTCNSVDVGENDDRLLLLYC